MDKKTRPTLRLTEGRQSIDPALAKQIREEAHYEGQRDMHEDDVDAWIYLYDHGHFIQGMQLHLARRGSRYYLVNGRHRLAMVEKMNKAVEFTLHITDCQNDKAVDDLYASLDIAGRMRSQLDAIRATKTDKQFGLGLGDTNRFMAAVVEIERRFGLNEKLPSPRLWSHPAVRFAISRKWLDAGKLYLGAVAKSQKPWTAILHRVPIMAGAMITLQYQPDRAAALWNRLAANDGLLQSDPARRFLDFLADVLIKKKQTGSGSGVIRNLITVTMLLWNAEFDNQPLAKIDPKTFRKMSLTFAGTPVNLPPRLPAKRGPKPKKRKA